jgi:hypothetical protein
VDHPLAAPACAGPGAYGAALWRYPTFTPACRARVAAASASRRGALDLLNEFDLLLAVTLWCLVRAPPMARVFLSGGARFAVRLLAAHSSLSAAIGLFPLPAFDANALGSYYTGFNSLRHLGASPGMALLRC